MSTDRSKTALVLTGGGIMGAAYQIGCLTALDRFLQPGFSSRRFDTYVGVSAGSVIATLVANRIEPAGLFRTIARNEHSVFNWRRRDIYRFDWLASLRSFAHLPFNFYQIFQTYRRNRWTFTLGDLPHLLHEQFPSGLFSLEPMQNYLCAAFHSGGVADRFEQLNSELLIPAYDLDSGERVIFGEDVRSGLHICQAITASCAIPFFFQPYLINDCAYIDGSNGRMTHLDLAIDKGAKLVVLINPRVPFQNDPELVCLPSYSSGQCSRIRDLGILFAWEQSQRIETRAKLNMALDYYRHRHPEVDIILLEPGTAESLLFFQGPMSIAARTQVMQHGFNLTQQYMIEHFSHLAAIFNKHGIACCRQRLNDLPHNLSTLLA